MNATTSKSNNGSIQYMTKTQRPYLNDVFVFNLSKFHVGIYTIIEEIKKEQIQMERRAEDIIRGRAHAPTRKE
ncbi:hypothetical protein QTP88_022081 [Uroleucon formosanum]